MYLKDVRKSIRSIEKSLSNIQNKRENIIKNSRDVISLSSQAIIAIHSNDFNGAKVKISKSKKILRSLRKGIPPELRHNILIAEQEFVEVSSLMAIIEKTKIPSFEKMEVSEDAYILGLLDCIGELKRQIVDRIRSGKVEESQEIFEIMEEMYLELLPLAVFDKIVKETRRKLDVNRILVEDTRAILTEEIRRQELMKVMRSVIEKK